MARKTRSSSLETRTARLRLEIRKKPYFVVLAPGIALGFRRNQGAGVWIVRCADGHGNAWTKKFAISDDHEEANNGSVLDYWQAQTKARAIARGSESGGDKPATVGDALAAYEANLKARGAAINNATRVRFNVPDTLLSKTVSLLTARELRAWRDGLVKNGLKPASANRTARMLAAALSLAANDDPRITNSAAWKTGLARLPDAGTARNVILTDDEVRTVVVAAYEIARDFGLLVETAAVTGQRASQILALTIGDLQNGQAPRLMMPSSKKGKRRRVERRPLPIPASLAKALKAASGDRPNNDAPLMLQGDGSRWSGIDLRMFRAATAKAGLDATVTPYALRHSSIVRQLLAGVPARICAASHDTSIMMLEQTYSKYITDHSDTLTRRALLDLGAPAAGTNVVPLTKGG